GFTIGDVSERHEQSWFVDFLAPHHSTSLTGTATFPRRGRQQISPLQATCLHPFGLARRTTTVGPPEECLGFPPLGKLNMTRFRHWLTHMMRSDERLHRVARPSMTQQDDLHGLRPFRPGDNPRWIHWRTTARRNMKMVREFEEMSGMNLIVVVDPST